QQLYAAIVACAPLPALAWSGGSGGWAPWATPPRLSTGPATAPALGQRRPPADAPPAPARVRHTNLPIPLTSFIGRGREVADVTQRMTVTRLVTLTGAGGCGKTRLALRVAEALHDAYPDGVWLASLAPLADPALVLQALATIFGLHDEPGRPELQ